MHNVIRNRNTEIENKVQEGVVHMKNNSFGTGLVAFLVFVGLIGLIGMAVKEDDYSESYSSRRQGAKRSNLHLFLHLLSVKI